MSFRLIGEYLRGVGKDKPQGASAPRIFADDALQALKPGATVDFSQALAGFVLATAAGALFEPPNGTVRVVAYSSLEEAGNLRVHRLYLAAAGSDPEHLLEVVTDRDNKPLPGEMKLFQQVADFSPETPEEWDMWYQEHGGDPPMLGAIKLDWQEKTFGRVWGTDESGNGALSIPPREYREHYHHSSGDQFTDMEAMLYGRQVSDTSEWLFVSILSREGSDGNDEKWIEAYIGVAITPEQVSIY